MHVADIEYTHDGTRLVGHVAVGDGPRRTEHPGGAGVPRCRRPRRPGQTHRLPIGGTRLRGLRPQLLHREWGETPPEDIGARFGALVGNVGLMRIDRSGPVFEVLVANEYADPGRVAAIGYSAGGTLSLNWPAAPRELAAVVGFHFRAVHDPARGRRQHRRQTFWCIGADDPIIPPNSAWPSKRRCGPPASTGRCTSRGRRAAALPTNPPMGAIRPFATTGGPTSVPGGP